MHTRRIALKFLQTFFSGITQKKTPFTNQREILEKYDQGINDNGELVGMCRPMSNTYLDLILKEKNPTEYLADDKEFLALSIHEENKELFAIQAGETDIDHFSFKENNIFHTDATFKKNELSPKKVTHLLENNQHLLITFPQQKDAHEVYLGKKSRQSTTCRFFDANLKGGERIDSCQSLIPQVVELIESQYSQEDKPFYVGMG